MFPALQPVHLSHRHILRLRLNQLARVDNNAGGLPKCTRTHTRFWLHNSTYTLCHQRSRNPRRSLDCPCLQRCSVGTTDIACLGFNMPGSVARHLVRPAKPRCAMGSCDQRAIPNVRQKDVRETMASQIAYSSLNGRCRTGLSVQDVAKTWTKKCLSNPVKTLRLARGRRALATSRYHCAHIVRIEGLSGCLPVVLAWPNAIASDIPLLCRCGFTTLGRKESLQIYTWHRVGLFLW